jgi:hypothetical protein
MPALLTTARAGRRCERRRDDAVGRGGVGDAVGVRGSRAAGRADLVDHALRRAHVLPFTGHRRADVVGDDFRAFARHRERNVAPDAATGAGDDHDLVFHHPAHLHSPVGH